MLQNTGIVIGVVFSYDPRFMMTVVIIAFNFMFMAGESTRNSQLWWIQGPRGVWPPAFRSLTSILIPQEDKKKKNKTSEQEKYSKMASR